MSAAEVARRQNLYGRDRNKGIDELRQQLTKSSVLRAGEYNFDIEKQKDGIWMTSSGIDFTGQTPATVGKLWHGNADFQLENHFELGNDSGKLVPSVVYQKSATKDNYDKKSAARPDIMQEDRTVNWPDMAPQYAVDRSIGTTEYSTTFLQQGLDQKAPNFPLQDTSKMRLPLDFEKVRKQKGVSVVFGSDGPNYISEAMRATRSAPVGGRQHSEAMMRDIAEAKMTQRAMKEMERNSNVFRSGDYNNKTQGTASVFTTDYGKKGHLPASFSRPATSPWKPLEGTTASLPRGTESDSCIFHTETPHLINHCMDTNVPEKFQDASDGKKDQTNAHFVFGSDDNRNGTIYDKDYKPGTLASRSRPPIAGVPPDSEVMHFDPNGQNRSSTTTGLEFGNHTELAAKLNADVQDDMKKNMRRRHGNNVVISYDTSRHLADRQASMCQSSYTTPPGDFKAMEALKQPRPLYNYLETDVIYPFSVPKTKTTEHQYQFPGAFMNRDKSIERRKWKDNQTKVRFDNGKETHFTFGYDPPNFRSEHLHEFQGKPKQDQAVPAAGKIEIIPECEFNHIDMSDNQQDVKPDPHVTNKMETLIARNLYITRSLPALPVHNTSIMKNDYTPVNKRKFTPAQVNMLGQDQKLRSKRIESSHLFHTDTSGNRNLESTVMADFIKPEQMTGKKYLAAR